MKTRIMYAVPFLHAKTGEPLDIEKSGAMALFSHRYTADDFVYGHGLEQIVKVRVTIESIEKRKAKPKPKPEKLIYARYDMANGCVDRWHF